MALVLDGTNGVSGVDGTASNPSLEGTDSNTGVFFPAADTVAIGTGGTEALRVNSSQQVGIGETSPAAPLHIKSATNNIMRLQSSDATTGNLYFSFYNSSGTQKGYIGYGNSGDDALQIQNEANSYMTFATNGSERARITSGGNLLVGQTADSQTTVGSIAYGSGGYSACRSETTNSTSTYTLYSTGASAFRFYVGMGGTINATSTTITGISDVRLKENIRDLDDGLDAVMALKPRKFDWKEGKGANTKDARGFIAQEFEEVFPDMIEQWMDEPPEGEEPYKAVNANLIPTLVKAIQELNAKVEAQAAEIAALKGTA